MQTPAAIAVSPLSKNLLDKDQLLKILKDNKEIKEEDENFRLLANGLFQAEGHVGGYFENEKSSTFIPIVFISLNAGGTQPESIKLFKKLNNQFNNELEYYISTTSTGKQHIRIFSKKWDIIINKWIPFFNSVYGDKKRGLVYLQQIFYLYYSKNGKGNKHTLYTKEIIDNIIKRIYLIYNLVDNSQRKIKLEKKIELVLIDKAVPLNIIENIDHNYYNKYLNSILDRFKTPSISILFILGFFLGDGNFNYILRINDKISLPWYIPELRISQKYTEDNIKLFKLIQEYFNNYGITVNIKKELRKDSNKEAVYLSIDNHSSIKLFSAKIKDYYLYYYNKRDQLELLNISCLLLGKVKYWRQANLILLSLIYKYKIVKNSKSSSVAGGAWWTSQDRFGLVENSNLILDNFTNLEARINKYFDTNQKPGYFISKYKDKGYVVKLPISTNPKSKYFFVKQDNWNEAYNNAINYRNATLDNWLKDNKLKA